MGKVSWKQHNGMYLGGYSKGKHKYNNLQTAARACYKRGKGCGGITYEPKSKKFTLRRGTKLRKSPSREVSWTKHSVSSTTTVRGHGHHGHRGHRGHHGHHRHHGHHGHRGHHRHHGHHGHRGHHGHHRRHGQ